MIRWTCALAALLLGPAGAVAAQATDALARPRYALSFGTFAGGQIAAGVRLSRRTDLGLAVGGSGSRATGRYNDSDGNVNTGRTFSVEPSLKRYLGPGGTLAPFLFVGVYGARSTSSSRSPSDSVSPAATWNAVLTSAGLDLGVGTEWFVAQRLSLGGRIGAGASFQRQVERWSSGAPARRGQGWWLGTQGSGVQATFYL